MNSVSTRHSNRLAATVAGQGGRNRAARQVPVAGMKRRAAMACFPFSLFSCPFVSCPRRTVAVLSMLVFLTTSPAHIVTAGIRTRSAAEVFVNVDQVAAETPLTIELLDEFDRPIPGFSGDAAASVAEAGVRIPVAWSQPIPPETTFSVRVTFPASGDARLYTAYVGGKSHE